jgi:hypothetical protein
MCVHTPHVRDTGRSPHGAGPGATGDTIIGEILNQVKEVINQPVDVLRMIEDYLRKMGRRATL